MAIIVFQHGEHIIPGRVGMTLRDHGFKLDIRHLYRTHNPRTGAAEPWVPTDYDNVEGVISLGGEPNVGDNEPWMQAELDFIRGAHERQLPVIGICLGSQMIAAALGGQVGPMEKPHWGFRKVSINTTGQVETMMSGIAWDSMQFVAHGQEIKVLPPNATLLASSAYCKVQAFRAGLRTYGFQYHPECDRAMIELFARTSRQCAEAGISPADVAAECDAHYPAFARLGDRLCVNLAAYLFPFERRATA